MFMKKKFRLQPPPRLITILTILLLLSAPIRVFAQDGDGASRAFGVVIYAEGQEVTIFRGDRLLTMDVVFDEVVGMDILEGDLIQTDDQTFLEIQLFPSRSIVNVAENTTFEVESIAESGGSFSLTYGRLRARVQRVTGTTPFQIRGSEAVAGVRGTDFGYDFVATRDTVGAPVTQVYVFDGEVIVADPGANLAEVLVDDVEDSAVEEPGDEDPADEDPADEDPAPAEEGTDTLGRVVARPAKAIILRAAEMATVARLPVVAGDTDLAGVPESFEVVFETDSLSEDIDSYWETNTFTEAPLELDEAIEAFPELSERLAALRIGPPVEPPPDVPPVDETPPGDETPPEEAGEPDDQEPPAEEAAPQEAGLIREAPPGEQPPAELVVTPQQRAASAGGVLTGIGSVVEVAGLVLSFAGPAIFPGADQTMLRTTSSALVVTGGAFLLGGIISFLLSLGN